MAIIESAEWWFDQTDSNLDEEMRWERAGLRIALFVRWLAEREMLELQFGPPSDPDLSKLKAGKLSATKFTETWMSYKLHDQDIREPMLPFVEAYYGDKGAYPDDLDKLLGGKTFNTAERDVDYARFRQMVDVRHSRFLALGAKAVQASAETRFLGAFRRLFGKV